MKKGNWVAESFMIVGGMAITSLGLVSIATLLENQRKRGDVSKEIMWLGSAPAEESCAQLGEADYARNAKAECLAYIQAIKRVCGEPPEGADLRVRAEMHDFGSYYEVAVVYDPSNRAAAEYAFKAESEAPTTWAAAGMEAPGRGRER